MSTAIALSGGGSKGDFQLGAIRYLYEVLRIEPTLIIGTSVGAVNGAKLAEGEATAETGLRALARTWFTLDGNGDMWLFEPWVRNAPPEIGAALRSLGDSHLFSKELPNSPSIRLPRDNTEAGAFRDLANLVTGFFFLVDAISTFGPAIAAGVEAASVANLNPIRDRIFGRGGFPAIFNPALVTEWAARGHRLRLAAVSLDSGELNFITETGQVLERGGTPLTDKRTGQPVFCELGEAVIASASIGVVFPPVKLGSEYYVDGGHRAVIPVDPIFDPTLGIRTAYLISASPIGLHPASFEETRTIGNIAARVQFEASIAEIVRNEITPRGGWGNCNATLIAPTMELHGMITVDPGLIRINVDYGWMRADDAVHGRDPGNRLFELSNEITSHRARIWFNEGRYLGSFPNAGLGEFSDLPNFRNTLQLLIDERRNLGGSLPPGAELWAQVGEAHSTSSGAAQLLNLYPIDGSHIATALSVKGEPILFIQDSLIGDRRETSRTFNENRRVVYSTHHVEPLLTDRVGWRVVGRSRLPPCAPISCIQARPQSTLLLAADEDGMISRAEGVPDGHGYTGWLPLNDGRTVPGGWVTGVSRRTGSFDVFVVATDGQPYTAARHMGEPNWGGWWSLPSGSFVPGSCIAAVSRNTDKLDIFAADANGAILRTAWQPRVTSWAEWSEIPSGRIAPGGYIAAISCAPDTVDIFVVGNDGNVYGTMWSPTQPWGTWVSLTMDGVRFFVRAFISVATPRPGMVVVAICDSNGHVQVASRSEPGSEFRSFTQIGTRTFSRETNVTLLATPDSGLHAYAIGTDGCVYRAILPAHLSSSWSDWVAISASLKDPVLVPPDTDAPFIDGRPHRTGDPADQIEVRVEGTAVPRDRVEFVLNAGPGIDWYKGLELVAPFSGRGEWSEWGSGGGLMATSGPAASLNAPGGLVVFARGPDNAIWHTWQDQIDGDWHPWESLGGSWTSGPAAAIYQDGRLNIFARGTDNAIWTRWQTTPNGEWSEWGSGGGLMATSGPAASLNAPGGLVVFARGPDNAIWHTWQDQIDGDWHPWESLGGSWTSGPAAAIYQDGRLNIFARGTDNAIWTRWQTTPNGEWSEWESLLGVLTSDPAATLNALGGLVVFARGTDNALWYTWQDYMDDEWHAWESLGGSWTSDPAAALYRDGRLNVFVRGTDNAIWTRWQTSLKTGHWKIYVKDNENSDRNSLYVDQLRGAELRFVKAKEFGRHVVVSRQSIDKVKPGSRVTFTWVRD